MTMPIAVISPYITNIIHTLTTLFNKLNTSNTIDDNYLELVRAGCRLVLVLNTKFTAGPSGPSGLLNTWKHDFITNIVMKNQKVVNILESLKHEKVM